MARQFMKLYCDILPRKDLTPAAKLVYTVLSDRICRQNPRTGEVAIGFRKLASLVGVSLTTVHRSVVQLVEKTDLGVTWAAPGAGRRHVYKLPAESALDSERSASESAPETEQGCARNGTPGAPDSERKRAINGTEARHKRNTYQTRPDNKGKTKTNPLFDAVVNLFLPSLWDAQAGRPNSEAITQAREGARIGRVVAMLKAKGGTPDELRLRRDRYRTAWPALACTAEALAKNWDEFAEDRPPAAATGGRAAPDHRAQKRAREFE